MPTLSFSCPKCSKQHDRIKPEMIGHKVKCQCGYVFRIGAKSSKQPGVAEELKRKKAIKQCGALSNARAAGSRNVKKPLSARPQSSPASSPAEAADIVDAIPVSRDRIVEKRVDAFPINEEIFLDDFESVEDLIPSAPAQPRPESEILDAIPIEPVPVPGTPNDPLMQIPAELLAHLPTDASRVRRTLPSNSLPSVAKGHRPTKRTSDQDLDSPIGPICTLALSALGLPVLIWVIWSFAVDAHDANEILNSPGDFPDQVTPGSLKSIFVASLMLCLMNVALAISIITSGVVSIIEWTRRIRIGWATKIATLIAGFLLVSLVLTCIWQVVAVFQFANAIRAMDDQAGQTVENFQVGFEALKIFIRYCLYGIVPLAALVIGIWRNLRP
jgi:hypothetical protein